MGQGRGREKEGRKYIGSHGNIDDRTLLCSLYTPGISEHMAKTGTDGGWETK